MDSHLPHNDGPSNSQVTITAANQRVLSYIEATFNAILQEIKARPGGKPVIMLKRTVAVRPYYDEDDMRRLKWLVEDREVRYCFPGKTKDEGWRFACVARILGEMHRAIKTGITVTKRDIYYHDPMLFKRQETVDRYVDDIAHTCQVTRRDLNVIASPKGLVAGLLPPSANDQVSIIHANCDRASAVGIDHLNWILVIEKEAKGYPDLATRHFLRLLLDHTDSPIPIFGLFDWDPDGIQIMKCYLYGSKNMAQEHGCNIPELKWIGLKAAQVQNTDQPSMFLTMRDRGAALSMLVSEEWRDGSDGVLPGLDEAVTELRRMLMLNRKAEIQILDERDGGLEEWLTRKLQVGLGETGA